MASGEGFDNSLFLYDAGYYQFMPGRWLPGKLVPGGTLTTPPEGVEAAATVPIDDSDVLIPNYPKTGGCLSPLTS